MIELHIAGNKDAMTTERIIYATDNTIVLAVDEPDPKFGGACHTYVVRDRATGAHLELIRFQKGPIGEVGVNGVQHVDMLAIIRDRLDCFQRGPLASPVNEVTCGLVSAAIASEDTRTRRRQIAGTEGTNRQ